jgi:predicted NAD/FAD-dependent oxidoreductase
MKLAIIGAGVAGLAAARTLRQHRPDLAITIYEQSRDLGGRVATRRRDGFVFDHGAQYMKAPTPELERLLRAELSAEDLRDIGRPVWVFDRAGVIAEGDPAQNVDPKWTYRGGLSRLGELLGAGLDVRREVRIARVRPTTNKAESVVRGPLSVADGNRERTIDEGLAKHGYELIDIAGHVVGEADLILITPPAPEAAAILAASDLDTGVKSFLVEELGRVSYRRCISLALAYDRRIERPFYALVNTDRGHPIAWLAFEHDKGPERCPPGHSLLIVQLAPQWSLDHWERSAEELAPLVAEQVGALLGEDLHTPLWADLQRWRYALPDSGADLTALNGTGSGLFVAGDHTAGLGRVHLAIESGWRAAAEIARRIEN